MFHILAIDPGLISLGYAIFGKDETEPCKLISFGSVKKRPGVGTDTPIEIRIQVAIEDLATQLGQYSVMNSIECVIEQPQPFGAYKSLASQQSGSLIKLYFLTGALFWWAQDHFALTLLVPVSTYKGQLPKVVTNKRMQEKYGREFKTTDEADAVYLGDWYYMKRYGDKHEHEQ